LLACGKSGDKHMSDLMEWSPESYIISIRSLHRGKQCAINHYVSIGLSFNLKRARCITNCK
jgi:hypothetical protein